MFAQVKHSHIRKSLARVVVQVEGNRTRRMYFYTWKQFSRWLVKTQNMYFHLHSMPVIFVCYKNILNQKTIFSYNKPVVL